LETAHGELAAAHAAASAERDRLVTALRAYAVHLEVLANGVPCGVGGSGAAETPVGRKEELA
jgi:hypothetical protein